VGFGQPTDLCSIEAVTSILGQVMPGAMDELATLIAACSTYVRNFCSRDFITTTYPELRDGTGTRSLSLSQYPVAAVASVVIDGIPRSPRAQMGDGGWILSPPNMLRLDGGTFNPGTANVLVTYTAGWPQAQLPADLSRAIAETVVLRWRERGRIGDKSKTVSVAGGSETVEFTLTDFPPFAKAVIARYQQVMPV
jgi:hypothetical protein